VDSAVDVSDSPAVGPRRPTFVLDGLVPVGIRIAGMLVQLVALAWLDGRRGPSLFDRLTKWDGQFYEQIAASGYSSQIRVAGDGSLTSGSELAFHPLYPGLATVLHLVTGMAVGPALLVTAAAAGTAASVVVHLLAVEISGSRGVGYLAAGLLGALPMSIVLQMAYAESLYLLLAAAALLFACRAQWWPAAFYAMAAGLTRPTGFVVAAVIPLAAWWLYRRSGRASQRGRTAPDGQTVPDGPALPDMRTLPDGRRLPVGQIALATCVGASGVAFFWAYLWVHTGVWDAWFVIEQRGWASHFDGGAQTFRFLRTSLQHPGGLVASVVCGIIIVYLLGLFASVVARQPPPIVGLALLSAGLALGSTNYWHSKPRLLLAAFALVVPAAQGLARMNLRAAAFLVCAGTVASAWFGAYMLDVWPYAI
jgi:hypothetical protein